MKTEFIIWKFHKIRKSRPLYVARVNKGLRIRMHVHLFAESLQRSKNAQRPLSVIECLLISFADAFPDLGRGVAWKEKSQTRYRIQWIDIMHAQRYRAHASQEFGTLRIQQPFRLTYRKVPQPVSKVASLRCSSCPSDFGFPNRLILGHAAAPYTSIKISYVLAIPHWKNPPTAWQLGSGSYGALVACKRGTDPTRAAGPFGTKTTRLG